ncbi:MAG: outer membrane lipid asymmetry maintenance protein MlaD [Desulfobacterales bacterium]|nr:outer membrane lipid asymmetry maintenance protein MlaD [Desulfobacterales bacterium]MDJ0912989.1 outer membrane lipid asymmetry maintenance protein MlaD [Desulfobacterales bacterium]
MQRVNIEIMVGIFVVIGLLCVGWLTIKLGQMSIMGDNHYQLIARFQSVSGLTAGAKIEIAGVQIGQVDGILFDQELQMAVVSLKIKKDIVLTDDVIASVKTAGLIGDKYVKLTPGGSDEVLKPGDIITETESTLDLEELISKYVFGGV